MGAFKQFLTSDVIVTPFEVNKGFTFAYSEFTDSDVQIDIFKGINEDFLTDKSTTGLNSTEYQVLIYNSIKELYYSNYLTSEIGGSPYTASVFLGENEAGNVLIGSSSSQGRYYNYPQTTLTQSKSFPTQSGAEIAVLSIPSRLYGDLIQPNSINITFSGSTTITDDGNGNLISGSEVIGNVIYQHGILTLTSGGSGNSLYGSGTYGGSLYGGGGGGTGTPGAGSAGGGSGIVIVRAPGTANISASPGTNTVTTLPAPAGGCKVATFTVSGDITVG